jgi:hypothetical protein
VDLHRGSLRAQREAVSRVERVGFAARRMVLRDVQRGEVVEVRLDLAAVFDDVAERDEDVFDALAQNRDRVTVAVRRTAAGQRHVDALARRALLFDVILEG